MTMSFWRIRCCVERCTMFIIWECLYSARYRFIRTFFYKREDEELTDEKNYFEGLCTPRCVLELRMKDKHEKGEPTKRFGVAIPFKEVMKMDLLSHLLCPIKEPEIDHHR
uniref:Uncharacterized protein n=1 Tax=Helianthus annuus TaxID=4232 RepID=A0A251TBI3_HELAN